MIEFEKEHEDEELLKADIREMQNEEKPDKLLLLSCIVIVFVGNTLQMNVSALLPAFVDDNFPNINAFQVGCLMGCFAVGFLVSAPILGLYMERVGRKNILLIGVIAMALATLIFGLASYFKNVYAFYIVSLIARLVQGTADATINITAPSIVAMLFPEKQEIYISWVYMALGAGLSFGPVMGSFFYSWTNYVDTFYIFFALIAFVCGPLTLYLPSSLNKSREEDEVLSSGVESEEVNEITYWKILQNRRSLLALLVSTAMCIMEVFLDPVLSVHLIDDLGMTEGNTGFAFALIGFSYTVFSPVAGMMQAKVQTRYINVMAFIISLIGVYLAGPTLLFGGLPNKIWIIMVGLFFLGTGAAFGSIPATAEIINSMCDQQKAKYFQQYTDRGSDVSRASTKTDEQYEVIRGALTDKASTLRNISFSLGTIIGPVMGGRLTDQHGFRHTCDIVSYMLLGGFVLYLLFAFLPDLWEKKKVVEPPFIPVNYSADS